MEREERVILASSGTLGQNLWRFARAVSVAEQKIDRQRRFAFRVPHDDAINMVTGGPPGHPDLTAVAKARGDDGATFNQN